MYCYNITKYYLSFAAKTTPVTRSLFLKGLFRYLPETVACYKYIIYR
ncbi:hypothetical protein CSC35_0935 [Enterobacter hormaechei]|nr:hypothetical protein CSC35_0935 [Enterobacter hormaechei]